MSSPALGQRLSFKPYFKTPANILIFGRSQSGKTYSCSHIFSNPGNFVTGDVSYPKTFNQIVIVSPTYDSNRNLWERLLNNCVQKQIINIQTNSLSSECLDTITTTLAEYDKKNKYDEQSTRPSSTDRSLNIMLASPVNLKRRNLVMRSETVTERKLHSDAQSIAHPAEYAISTNNHIILPSVPSCNKNEQVYQQSKSFPLCKRILPNLIIFDDVAICSRSALASQQSSERISEFARVYGHHNNCVIVRLAQCVSQREKTFYENTSYVLLQSKDHTSFGKDIHSICCKNGRVEHAKEKQDMIKSVLEASTAAYNMGLPFVIIDQNQICNQEGMRGLFTSFVCGFLQEKTYKAVIDKEYANSFVYSKVANPCLVRLGTSLPDHSVPIVRNRRPRVTGHQPEAAAAPSNAEETSTTEETPKRRHVQTLTSQTPSICDTIAPESGKHTHGTTTTGKPTTDSQSEIYSTPEKKKRTAAPRQTE